jgi:alkylated DNA repair dioxygenase AlkB
MKPFYKRNYSDGDTTVDRNIYTHLLNLDWLSVTEARLEYFMSDKPRSYIYGKPPHDREYFSSTYTEEVLKVQQLLNSKLGTDYNVCFLNRYNTQRHQLGWHADDSPTMDKEHPIAVISFGAEREIWWKLKEEKRSSAARTETKIRAWFFVHNASRFSGFILSSNS